MQLLKTSTLSPNEVPALGSSTADAHVVTQSRVVLLGEQEDRRREGEEELRQASCSDNTETLEIGRAVDEDAGKGGVETA
jgi:hypothetical protein